MMLTEEDVRRIVREEIEASKRRKIDFNAVDGAITADQVIVEICRRLDDNL